MFLLGDGNKSSPEVFEAVPQKRRKIGLPHSKKGISLLAVVLVLILVSAGFIYTKTYPKTTNGRLISQNEIKDLVSKVGKLIELPKDEKPTIATVSDKSKLSGQAFFAKAENGDKVLIYPKARKAVLYRPSTNQIIEVAFYNPPKPANTSPAQEVAGAATSPSPTPTPTPTPKPSPTRTPSPQGASPTASSTPTP